MGNYHLEVCVDSYESALEAQRGGADRLLLCSNLVIGGTTPNINLFHEVRNHLDMEICVLIRPRCGDFLYSSGDFEIMKNDIAMFNDAGAQGVAIGMLEPEGAIDIARMDGLMAYTVGMEVTLNRAFDFCRDPIEVLNQVKMLGMNRIITSGQKKDCQEGRSLIAQLILMAGDVKIVAGGGITSDNIAALCRVTGATSYLVSANKETGSAMRYRKRNISMGMPAKEQYQNRMADSFEIAKIKAILNQ